MSAVDNYREFTDVPPSHYLPHATLRRYADAAIMELEWAIAQWHAEEDDWVRDRATLEAELAALKEQAVRWEAMYEGQTAEKDGLEAELARTLVIMREGGCRDCDDLGEELAALKTENERLTEELACRTDGFWKREEECEALAERLNVKDADKLEADAYEQMAEEVLGQRNDRIAELEAELAIQYARYELLRDENVRLLGGGGR